MNTVITIFCQMFENQANYTEKKQTSAQIKPEKKEFPKAWPAMLLCVYQILTVADLSFF